jgi:DNA-directed RNA polymerase II subunit RPB1
MGSIDRQFKCTSCGETAPECIGHFGHIELQTPVFHPGFMRKIQKLLECVCHNCGKILSDEVRPLWLRDLC